MGKRTRNLATSNKDGTQCTQSIAYFHDNNYYSSRIDLHAFRSWVRTSNAFRNDSYSYPFLGFGWLDMAHCVPNGCSENRFLFEFHFNLCQLLRDVSCDLGLSKMAKVWEKRPEHSLLLKFSHTRPFRRFFAIKQITEGKKLSIEIEMPSNSLRYFIETRWHGAAEGWIASVRSFQTARHFYTKVFNACSADEHRTHTHTRARKRTNTQKESNEIFWQIYYVRAVLTLNYISRAERDKTIFYFIIIITFLFMQGVISSLHCIQQHFSPAATK